MLITIIIIIILVLLAINLWRDYLISFLLFLSLLLILYMTLIVNFLRLLHPSFLIIKQGIASSLARFFFTF
jgi:hypothetical protein